jgi:hypothetical protein
MFLFESSVSFIFHLVRLSSQFHFACFLVFIASCVIYTYLDCAAKLVLFGVRFSFARTARRSDERCENIKSV